MEKVLSLIAIMFFFCCTSAAQHTKNSLLQPDYDDYNLKAWPRQITVVQHYQSGNDINFQEEYYFDSTGHLTEYRKRGFGGEQVTHFPLQSLPQNKEYQFDFDGDVLELTVRDQKGRVGSSEHFIYAESGNLAMTVEYTYSAINGIVEHRTVSTYDKQDRLTRVEQYTADELLLYTEVLKYDRQGNLKSRVRTFYNDDETTTVSNESRKYTYDRRGNWTTCQLMAEGKTICTIERSIEYYGEE